MRAHCWPLYRRYLQRSRRPVLCGPFRGEVGFEALYWVPFLKRLGLAPERLIPITRGGAHLWYPCARHVELYALRAPREVRVENLYQHKRTGMLKQRHVSDFDRGVIRDAAASLGLRSYDVLHPAWMYRTLTPFWDARTGVGWLLRRVAAEPLPPVDATGLTLPPSYVAVRFYARHTFPLTETTRQLVAATITQLAERQPVIVLNADVHADEHADFPVPAVPNVIQLKGQSVVTAENNLAIQSAILSRALGFVGTYGGLAQLALMYRKPTVSVFTEWGGTALAHKQWADALALMFGVTCQVVKVGDVGILRQVLPEVLVSAPARQEAPADPVFVGAARLASA